MPGEQVELNEFEFNLTVTVNAFNRWAARGMAAAGMKDLSEIDIQVLLNVDRLAGRCGLARICAAMNADDGRAVPYSLKKLCRLGLLRSAKKGKEVLFSMHPAGRALCKRYRAIRHHLLISALSAHRGRPFDAAQLAKCLLRVSLLYGKAAARPGSPGRPGLLLHNPQVRRRRRVQIRR